MLLSAVGSPYPFEIKGPFVSVKSFDSLAYHMIKELPHPWSLKSLSRPFKWGTACKGLHLNVHEKRKSSSVVVFQLSYFRFPSQLFKVLGSGCLDLLE